MKKLLALFVSILLVMSFAGCGKSEESPHRDFMIAITEAPQEEQEKVVDCLDFTLAKGEQAEMMC